MDISKIEDSRLAECGWSTIVDAETLFMELGIREDFCIQAIGSESIVFGGTNRIIWHPRNGYRIDYDYCSQKVIDKFYDIIGRKG